jgi:hypothetical protein
MLHPLDANLISLYSISTKTKLFVVRDEKTKKYTVSYLSPPVHGTEFQSFQTPTKREQLGFVLKGTQKRNWGQTPSKF